MKEFMLFVSIGRFHVQHNMCTSMTFVTCYQPRAIYTIQYTNKYTSTLGFISRLIHDRIGQSSNPMRNRTADLIPILEPHPGRSTIPDSRRSTCNNDRPSWQGGTLRHVGDDPNRQLSNEVRRRTVRWKRSLNLRNRLG